MVFLEAAGLAGYSSTCNSFSGNFCFMSLGLVVFDWVKPVCHPTAVGWVRDEVTSSVFGRALSEPVVM